MPTGDLELANGVMKIAGGMLTKQFEESALLYNRMNKGRGTKISDRGYEIPTHLEGNYNHAFIPDGGNMPAGGANRVRRATVFFRNYAHSVRVTGAAIDAISSLDTAYIKDWMQFNLTESVSAGHKMFNIYGWGVGNGRLATISTGANSTTQTVNNNDANRYLNTGILIDIVSSDGVTTRGTQTISNARATSTTFTIDAAINSTTGDLVVAAGSYNAAVTGMKQTIDDTTDGGVTYQGISRNDYLSYRAVRVNAATTGLDASYMRRLLGAGIHVNVGELNREALEIWSHPAQTQAYASMGWNLKRFEGKSKSFDLGFLTYEFEGIRWVEDIDAPKDEVYFIDWSTMHKFTARDFGWDDRTGSILNRVPSASNGRAYTDQYEAYLVARCNYGCTRPNKSGWIDTLTIPTGY